MIARPTADLYQILDLSYDPNEEFAPHTDELPRISIVLSGQLLETAGDKEEWASAASMVFKPGDLRHFNRFGREGARLVSVAFSEEGFRALCDPVENRSFADQGQDARNRCVAGWRTGRPFRSCR